MQLEVNICKKLKEFTLQAEFVLHDGVLGLMGSSGSGKSMLLKCLAGIEIPDCGRIVLNGRVLFDSTEKINLPPQQRRIGYLFQNYALFPNMSVAENIMCGPRAKGLKQEQSRAIVQAMVNKFQLQGLEARYPRQLSGGQKQRTALARLLAVEPEVILLDEPFSALDAQLKEKLQEQLQQLLQEYGGISVLVSHDRQEIERLSDSVLLIHQGILSEEDKTC